MKTRLLAVGLLAALALTACGDEALGGTAATVAGEPGISVERLSDLVQDAKDDPAATTARQDIGEFQRGLLGSIVYGQVVQAVADRPDVDVDVTQSQVDAQYAQLAEANGGEQALLATAAEQGLSRDLLLQLQRSRALSLAVGLKLTEDVYVDPSRLAQTYAQNKDSFDKATISQVLLPDEATARALLAQARGLSDDAFKALVSERSTDEQSKATGGVVGPLTQGTLSSQGQTVLASAIFGARQGDTIVVPTQGGAYLIRILSRDTQTLEQATPTLRQTVLSDDIQQAIDASLSSVKVEINPRFGTWDPTTGTVLAPGSGGGRELSRKTSSLLSSGTAQASQAPQAEATPAAP